MVEKVELNNKDIRLSSVFSSDIFFHLGVIVVLIGLLGNYFHRNHLIVLLLGLGMTFLCSYAVIMYRLSKIRR